MTTTWLCATIIQARWRSYRVRRAEQDAAATHIERIVRGRQARRDLQRHDASVLIQRHCRGALTRDNMRLKRRSALKMTCLVRGFLARCRTREKRRHLTEVAIKIQCLVRKFIACRRVCQERARRDHGQAVQKAATDVQRAFRGSQGRKQFKATRAQYLQDVEQYQAARKVQAQVRRREAAARVDRIREKKREQMNHAATFMRKVWVGYKARKRFRERLSEYAKQERHVVTVQRFARGFLVRLHMWREAIRAEEELWGALEIQRVWRGYIGRAQWEDKYEEIWLRETSAATIQRNLRGYLARIMVSRMRRKIARAEFDRARLRFRSAQRVQALARGVLARKVFQRRFTRAVRAAVCIQRFVRGHMLRRKLWMRVIEMRAITIQAHLRGWLVRRRKRQLLAKVICVQRHFRTWQKLPAHQKDRGVAKMRERKAKATLIQGNARGFLERRAVARVQQGSAAGLGSGA